MAAKQFLVPGNHATVRGLAAPGAIAKLYTTGTLTPQPFYSTSALSVSLGSTITADGIGVFPECYQDEATPFRLIITDRNGVELDGGDVDPFYFGVSNVLLPAAAMDFATRALMAAVTASAGSTAYLTESGREGTFVWSSSNLSAEVTLDPQQGVYVAPSSDTTGASGAWVRKDRTVTPFMFGAVGDGTTSDKTALDAMVTWFFASVRTDRHADFTGNFGYAGTFNLGPSSDSDNNLSRYNVGGDLRIVQKTAATFETIKVRFLALTTWHGRITAQGIGSTTFASRTCAIGISFVSCQSMKVTGGLRAYSFWFHGIAFQSVGNGTGTGFNDAASIGTVRAYYCGSGLSIAGYSLTANWTTPVNNGSTNSTVQTTTITIDTLPDAAVETYCTVGNQPLGVVIAGQYYQVQSWNRGALTINIYPWLDNTSFGTGSGTLRWVFGAGVSTWGSDSGIIQFDHIQAIDCGIGFHDGALYGSRLKSANLTSNGIALAIGSLTSGGHIGTSIDAMYTEANDFDIGHIAPRGAANISYIHSTYGLSLSKCFALSPRLTDGRMVQTAFGTGQSSGDVLTNSVSLAANGYLYWFHKRQIGNELGASMTFREHGRPPRILTQAVNTQTITLTVQGSGEYNSLFGYNGATLRYVGTGTGGTPTGSFTFAPPSGGTVNGGAVDATSVISGFDGPADFEVYHTDTAQLTWIARCVAGKALSSDVTTAAGGVATIAANAVSYAKLQQLAALSVVGNATNGTANATSVAAGADFNILRRSGTAIGFGAIDLSQAGAVGTSRLARANMAQIAASSLSGNPTGSLADESAITLAAELGFSGTTLQVATNGITYAKFQQVAASSLVGNPTGSLANAQAITLAGGLAFSGTTLTAAGALTPTSIASTGAVTSSSATAGIGYVTGAGGAVTQLTSKSTAPPAINKLCGQITMNNAALAAAAKVFFTVSNTSCAATDGPTVWVVSGGTANAYRAWVSAVAANSFTVGVENVTAGSLSEAPVIGFFINKAVAA